MSFLKNPGPTDILHRCDVWFCFCVENCNPNGAPDKDGEPRHDPETGHGLASPVCIKRHIRDTLPHLVDGRAGFGIYVQRGSVLDDQLKENYKVLGLTPNREATKKAKAEAKAAAKAAAEAGEPPPDESRREDPEQTAKAKARMCQEKADIRWFGAVMASKVAHSGQVRGPLQFGWSKTVDPIMACKETITRGAFQTQRESEESFSNQTMGDMHRVPFGLYYGHAYYNPPFGKKTGFHEEDLKLFWETMGCLFQYTRSSSRGDIWMEQVIVFEHDGELGRAPSHRLFGAVEGIGEDGKPYLRRKDEGRPARRREDYIIPAKDEVERRLEAAGIRGVKVHYLL